MTFLQTAYKNNTDKSASGYQFLRLLLTRARPALEADVIVNRIVKTLLAPGQSFLVLALHQTMHRGNVTDARRAAGRAALATHAAS